MNAVKNALSKSFIGKMAVFEYEKVAKGRGYTLNKKLVFDNIPCLLTGMVSKRSVTRDTNFDNVNKLEMVKKVFLSNEFNIKLGSTVEILQNGRVYTFEYAGESFLYHTHQEILLEHKKNI